MGAVPRSCYFSPKIGARVCPERPGLGYGHAGLISSGRLCFRVTKFTSLPGTTTTRTTCASSNGIPPRRCERGERGEQGEQMTRFVSFVPHVRDARNVRLILSPHSPVSPAPRRCPPPACRP